jgi:tRNA-dihydrouridine synthase B
MIKPLQIGKLSFATNLIQGPLAGYTCAPMRVQTWKYGKVAYCSTEMISANYLVHAKKPPRRYVERDPLEGPLCVQLSASDPVDLAIATRTVNLQGAELIELNCGCPVAKIRRKNAGSRLLSDLDRLKRLCAALRENTEAAVSIKIRVSGEANDQDDFQIAKIIEESGADCLVVHGRHWGERYDVPCRNQQIAQLVSAVKIPVIGNGDVADQASLQAMFEETGCAGVMIARATVGQPWLFAELSDPDFIKPSGPEILAVFIDHMNRLADLDTEYRALLQARKIVKYYLRGCVEKPVDYMQAVMHCADLPALYTMVEAFLKLSLTNQA